MFQINQTRSGRAFGVTEVSLDGSDRPKQTRQVGPLGEADVGLSNNEGSPLRQRDTAPGRLVVRFDQKSPSIVFCHRKVLAPAHEKKISPRRPNRCVPQQPDAPGVSNVHAAQPEYCKLPGDIGRIGGAS